MSTTTHLVNWMKAAGEPSRLRLLALCSERDLSVTDLARAVGQSGPRVSRHLKILCEAGLLERVRQGQWVHYRLAETEDAARFMRGLLSQLERAESVLKRDRQRARLDEPSSSAAEVTAGSRLGRNLAAFVREQGPSVRLESALLIGVQHTELIEAAASMAVECSIVVAGRRAAQTAERFAETRGLRCEVRATAALNALQSTTEVDAMVVECLATPATSLVPLLAGVRTALGERGRLWLFVGYDALQESSRRAAQPSDSTVMNPLVRIRTLLSAAGLVCARLSPIEADGEHVLAVYATPAAVAVSAAPSAREAS
jgi:DNA-binding transcriptional ArsR family regulator